MNPPFDIRRPLLSLSAASALLNSTEIAMDRALDGGEFSGFDIAPHGPRRCCRLLTRDVLFYKSGQAVPRREPLAATLALVLPESRDRFNVSELSFAWHCDAGHVIGLIRAGFLEGIQDRTGLRPWWIPRHSAAAFLESRTLQ